MLVWALGAGSVGATCAKALVEAISEAANADMVATPARLNEAVILVPLSLGPVGPLRGQRLRAGFRLNLP